MLSSLDSAALIRLTTRGGHERVVLSDDLVMASIGGRPPRATPAGALGVGDFLAIRYGDHAWPTKAYALPRLPHRPRYGSEKAIVLPTTMTSELAFLLGAFAAEGHTTRSNWSVIVTNSVDVVLRRVQVAWLSLFGLTARITRQADRCPGVVVSSKRLIEFLDNLGCGSRASNKGVPEAVMAGTREHALAFLQGMALDAYTTHRGSGKWAICLESKRAIDQLQVLCTRLGIVNSQISKFSRQTGKTYFELYAAGPWGQQMCRLVPFLEPEKSQRAGELRARIYSGVSASDIIPGLSGPELYSMIPIGRSGRNGRGTGRQKFAHLLDKRTQYVSRSTVSKVRAIGIDLPSWVVDVLDKAIHFPPLVSVVPADRPLGR